MTDNLGRLRAADFAANWRNNTEKDSAVYHFSGLEIASRGGPPRRCTVTITFEPDDKTVPPKMLRVEQHEMVSA